MCEVVEGEGAWAAARGCVSTRPSRNRPQCAHSTTGWHMPPRSTTGARARGPRPQARAYPQLACLTCPTSLTCSCVARPFTETTGGSPPFWPPFCRQGGGTGVLCGWLGSRGGGQACSAGGWALRAAGHSARGRQSHRACAGEHTGGGGEWGVGQQDGIMGPRGDEACVTLCPPFFWSERARGEGSGRKS